MGRPRRPYRRVTRLEQSHYRHPHGGSQVANPTIVSDIPAGSREPAAKLKKITEPARLRQLFFWTGQPFDGDGQLRG